MVWDIGQAMRRKEEFESSRLLDFAFRLRVRTAGRFAAELGWDRADLVARTEANRNYQKSDLLQTIRILKNYDFFKGPQMELFKTRKPKRG